MCRASISASRLKASSITAWTFSGLTAGLIVMRSVTPTTPRTLRIIRSTSRRWYSYSTSPSSVTQPADTPGDVGVVPRRAGQLDLQVVGHRLDPVHALGGPGRGQPLCVGRDVTGQGHRAVLNRDADGVRLGDLRVPLQLVDDVIPDLTVGFHLFTLLRIGPQIAPRGARPHHPSG